MAKSDAQHNSAKKVKLVEQFRFSESHYKTLSGSSQSIEDITGVAIPGGVAEANPIAHVEIIPEADVNIRFDGDPATTANGKIKAGSPKLIPGTKTELDNVEIIGSGGISIFYVITNTDFQGS